MPTPERIKAASREKRQRVCVICGASFMVASADRVGRTCSRPCMVKRMSQAKKGRKQSPETCAKRSQALREKWANDPEGRARLNEASAERMRQWRADPVNAQACAERASERMKRRHADPEWQKVRDERSARTMKATWLKHREHLIAVAVERYASGVGINSPEARARKAAACKWIFTKAQEALHTETDYNAVYAEVQARLRQEMPYDGPQEGSDYMEYLGKLGRETVNSPECRTLADTFMSEAIPRFAAEWNKRKLAA
jgi:hypothetical protein